MDVRGYCYEIAYDYLKRNLPSAEAAIMLAPGIADAFAPTITKLMEVLRLAKRMKMYQPVGCAQYRREMHELIAAAQAALAELDKP